MMPRRAILLLLAAASAVCTFGPAALPAGGSRRALAADGATEFLFVLGVPRFVGAVQAVINPIAIR